MSSSLGSSSENDPRQLNGCSRQRRRGVQPFDDAGSRKEQHCRNERQAGIESDSSGSKKYKTSDTRHGSHRVRRKSQDFTRRSSAHIRTEGEIRQLFEKCQGMLDIIQRTEGATRNHEPKASSSAISRSQPTWMTKKVIDRVLSSDGDTMLHKLEVSLLCPLTQARLVTPVRGQHCHHLQCFDGEAYNRLMAGKHWSKWLCPCCRSEALPGHLIIDVFTQELLKEAPEDAKIVEFTSSTDWKVKQDISDIMQESQTKDAVVDLTGIPDTPVRVVSAKTGDGGYMSVNNSVIDLTMSP